MSKTIFQMHIFCFSTLTASIYAFCSLCPPLIHICCYSIVCYNCMTILHSAY